MKELSLVSVNDKYYHFSDGHTVQHSCYCNACENWSGCGWNNSGTYGHDPTSSVGDYRIEEPYKTLIEQYKLTLK